MWKYCFHNVKGHKDKKDKQSMVYLLINHLQNYIFVSPHQEVPPDHSGNHIDSFRKLNSLRPRLIRRHFADDIFKSIFFNENVWISIKLSLKFVPKGLINNIPALVPIMAWRRSGDKPLSEPMMVSLSTHICVTRPQWVNQHRHIFLSTIFRMFRWVQDKLSPIDIDYVLKLF